VVRRGDQKGKVRKEWTPYILKHGHAYVLSVGTKADLDDLGRTLVRCHSNRVI